MSPKPADDLRRSAEVRLVQMPPAAPEIAADELLHEFQVYQIELEMMNDEMRRALITLEEARDRYLDLYEFAPVGYFTLNSAGMIAEVNLTGASLLGEERGLLLKRRFAQFIAPEDRDEWHQEILRVALHGDRKSFELALQRTDGSRFQARLDCLPRIDSGKVPVLRVAVTDISERLLAEEELRIADIAFESREGMVVTDAQGTIVRANQAFCRLTGFSSNEVVGNTLALLKSDHHDEAFHQSLWSTLMREGHWQGEIWNRHKNGKIYAEWMNLDAVRAPDGRTTHYVGTLSDITRNDEAEAEIHRLAYYDPLTQLPNRRLLMDRLGQSLAAGSRSGRHGALLFLDLDGFKNINDTHGHGVGDLLLIEVTRRLHEVVREGDSLSRLGGDEFVVVLENLSAEAAEAAIQAESVGGKVLESLARPYQHAGREIHCTASLGIALFRGHDEAIETLFKQADLALYQAKGAMKNCLRFFDPAMQATMEERGALEKDLGMAVKRGQLQLHYQAQIDRARRIIGAEALLRWRHPKRGLVAPDVFIPLAEESGLIHSIGHWVLKAACAQIKAWAAHPATRDLRLTVNVSTRQFRQPGFVEEVRHVLANSGANPTRLKLEIAENLFADNVADITGKMQELKTLGIGFSMDDFGAGHSLLSYLKLLPLEQIKIDRSFVNGLVTDDNNAAIVQTLIAMGQAMGLKVVAEGVETEAQLEYLDQHDCAHFQGNVFSQALPLPEFEKLLDASPRKTRTRRSPRAPAATA